MLERVASYAEEHPARTVATAAAVGGVVLYRALQPEKGSDGGQNYFDIIGNLDQCIREGVEGDVSYAMLGGGAAAALMDPRTVLDVEHKLIIPPKGIRKDQYRRDTGTMADVDILIDSADEKVVEAFRAALEPNRAVLESEESTEAQKAEELAKPGARLKVGVTGLLSGEEYYRPPRGIEQAVHAIKKDWVSQRLLNPDGSKAFAIADVDVGLPDEYFEQWHVQLENGETVPTLHPLVQVLSYLSRASHGIRRRDVKKVSKIMDNVGPVFGAELVWGKKQQTASVALAETADVDDGVKAAIVFCDAKNALRWKDTKDRLGKPEAALLAARIALHRPLDTYDIFVQFGQGGWFYDNVLSRFSGESQQRLPAAG